MKFRELVELHEDKDYTTPYIHLTFETLYDMKQRIEFLPFIYQEKRIMADPLEQQNLNSH